MSYNRNNNRTNRAHIHTDGACTNNGYDGAKGGYGVYWGDNDSRNISEPLTGRQTNNRAEIEGARRGIEQAKNLGFDSVKVSTDSDFLYKSATQYMPNWERNGWTKSDGSPVVNREDFQALKESSRGIDVQWERVPGHSGNHGNEAADRLARDGARK